MTDPQRWEVADSYRVGEARVGLGDGLVVDVENLSWAGEGQTTAELQRNPDVTLCFALVESGPNRGLLCQKPAGAGTTHPGVGLCYRHGGNTERGLREGAWIVAHAFARALDVTPWEGLLTAVKVAAGKLAFCEQKIAQAEVDRQLEPPSESAISEAGRTHDAQGNNLHFWVKQSELWHDKLARVSQMAIQAGVAERLVRQVELEAQLMLRATSLTFEELGLSEDVRERALGIMARNLVALEAAETSEKVEEER